MSNQIDLGYLCGRTRKRKKFMGKPKPRTSTTFRKLGNGSRSPGANAGRMAKIVSFCPICPTNLADPERSESVPARKPRRVGRCRYGHEWLIGGEAILGGADGTVREIAGRAVEEAR